MNDPPLHVNSYDPFSEVTLKTRIRQLLHTHQGRDKLFKVAQYFLRLQLWVTGIDVNLKFISNAAQDAFSVTEKNLMTIANSRRLFRVGRFIAEFLRLRVTLIKCSELVYSPFKNPWMSVFLQSQMLSDISARLLMCLKSLCDDLAFASQKGFLNSNIADALVWYSARLALLVLAIDLYLNSIRLLQGLVDAKSEQFAKENGETAVPHFSLLSTYDSADKFRKERASASPRAVPSPRVEDTKDLNELKNLSFVYDRPVSIEQPPKQPTILVDSYAKLLWYDFELHWVFVTQVKLLLDLLTVFSLVLGWSQKRMGLVATCGLVSGLLSVYRVWTYGR